MRFERFRQDKDQAIFGQVQGELEDVCQARLVRGLSDGQLLTALCEAKVGTRYRIALESELRRREAWASPTRYALAISCLALLLAAAAFATVFWGADLQELAARLSSLI